MVQIMKKTYPSKLNIHRIIAISLIFFTFFMSALVSRQVFERLPHLEDEVAYLYQAKIFARGELVVDIPEPRRSFWQPFVVDHTPSGHRFGKYTPGYPFILSFGVAMGQAWIINALLASLTVALTYRLGSELFGRDTALIATTLVTFSPAALLLNASLMGHTAALFFVMLFILSYLRLEQGNRAHLWGILAGFALGMIAITRPLSALAVAFPFVVASGLRLGWHLLPFQWNQFRIVLTPLLTIAVVGASVAMIIPAFNHVATGDAGQNLYELVWSYDKIGFGECCGRNGHRLEKAFLHTRYDLSLTAADVFGWQIGEITPEIETHLQTSAREYPNLGLGFFLLPFGLISALFMATHFSWRTRSIITAVWIVGALFWVFLPFQLGIEAQRDISFSWIWVLVALGWSMMPYIFYDEADTRARYAWLMVALVMSVVVFQMTYWIGSQRYSTRYYYEALVATAFVTAFAITWLSRRIGQWKVYGALLIISIFFLYTYTTPRIMALYRFNNIGQHWIEQLEQRRLPDTPALVIMTGPASGDDRVRWRAMGTFMTLTNPFLDSDVVLAWDYGGVRQQLLAQFPDRQIIDMTATGNQAVFITEPIDRAE